MNGIKKKYIAYIMVGTILIYGIVRYFNVVEGYIKNITKALIPFVVGAIMAYIINILMDSYEDLLLKKFHNKKIKERAEKENREIDFQMTIDDIFAMSQGKLINKKSRE